jgi:hypothetical protein
VRHDPTLAGRFCGIGIEEKKHHQADNRTKQREALDEPSAANDVLPYRHTPILARRGGDVMNAVLTPAVERCDANIPSSLHGIYSSKRALFWRE